MSTRTRGRRHRFATATLAAVALAAVAAAAAGCGGSPQPAPDVAGTWLGSLMATGAPPLRIVFNLSAVPAGGLAGTVDVPEQGLIAHPLTFVELEERTLRIGIAEFAASYAGTVAPDEASIEGTFIQAGEFLPLVIEKQPGPLDYRRPQDPVPPLPYQTLDVTFPGPAAGVTLAGTLSWPSGAGPFKTVVLIAGSGPNDRDEELLNHRPFLVLSDALARAGIATLRYDKRGIGASTGDYPSATSLDFAADARAAAGYLRAQTHFAVSSIGLVGHSEGGMLAPMVADGNADVAYLVLLAAPGLNGEETIVSQQRAVAAAQGAPATVLDANEALSRELFAALRTIEDPVQLNQRLRAILVAGDVTGADQDAIVGALTTPWMRFFATYDPLPVLRRTRVPVLALTGSLDLQVLPALNLPPIRAALAEAGNSAATVEELPGLNHLFQHAMTGLPTEYGAIAETMSPEVLDRIASWLAAR